MNMQVVWMAARPLGLVVLLAAAAIVVAQDPPPRAADAVRPGERPPPGRQQAQPAQPSAPGKQPRQPARVSRLPTERQPPEARLPKALVDTGRLMVLFNKPLYELLSEEMKGIEPLDDKKRQTIEDRGLQAAEVANLIAIRPHGSNPQEQQRWHAMAAALQEAGLKLAETAQREDAQAVHQAYTGLIQRCNACHQSAAPGHAPQLEP